MGLSDLAVVPARLRLLLLVDLGHGGVGDITFGWALVHALLEKKCVGRCGCPYVLFNHIVVLDGSEVQERLLLDGLG